MTKIIRYGLSGNPVTLAHARIVQALASMCDQLNVAVCGPRDDKASSTLLLPEDRAALVVLGFPNLPSNVFLNTADLTRLGQEKRQSSYEQMTALREQMPVTSLWLAVGADQVKGGLQASEICTKWIEGVRLWNEFSFYIVRREGCELSLADCPPMSQVLIDLPPMVESSTAAREAAERGDHNALLEHVNEEVARYILARKLYQ